MLTYHIQHTDYLDNNHYDSQRVLSFREYFQPILEFLNYTA